MGGCNLFYSDEILVAEDDVMSVGMTVKSFVIEFDQVVFEAYQSDLRALSLRNNITKSWQAFVPMHKNSQHALPSLSQSLHLKMVMLRIKPVASTFHKLSQKVFRDALSPLKRKRNVELWQRHHEHQ